MATCFNGSSPSANNGESLETQSSVESESGIVGTTGSGNSSNCSKDSRHDFEAEFFYPSASGTIPSMESCLTAFDQDGDECLNLSEYLNLCRAIFRDERNKPYKIDSKKIKDMFDTFDANDDGLIDEKEFEICWTKWIKKIVRPTCALVIVDVQNDFISGSLSISNCPAKQNGEEVVDPINRLIDSVEFDCVFYTLDWHPENHISFVDNFSLRPLHKSSEVRYPKLYETVVFDGKTVVQQKLWPRHCVQNSWGAKLHENLKVVEGSPFIYKGTNPDVDSYSAFWDNSKLAATTLCDELNNKGVTDVFICGLAYDVCVGATALHSCELGFRTILINDASRGITLQDMQNTRQTLKENYGVVVECEQVKAMVQGIDRRFELGYKLVLDMKK